MDILAQLKKSLIIPVVRVDNETQALAAAEALINAGMTAIEITMTVKGAASAIAELGKRHSGKILVGAGTVLTREEAESALNAGAQFAVSPAFSETVLEFCRKNGLFFIPGVFTPTEILRTRNAGCKIVKIFPASSAGGPAFIRAMKSLFPDLEFLPTGGVGLDNMREYFESGAALVGSGGDLVDRTLVAENRYDEICKKARKFLDLAKSLRPENF